MSAPTSTPFTCGSIKTNQNRHHYISALAWLLSRGKLMIIKCLCIAIYFVSIFSATVLWWAGLGYILIAYHAIKNLTHGGDG